MDEEFPDTLPHDAFQDEAPQEEPDAPAASAAPHPAEDFPDTLPHEEMAKQDFPDSISPEEFAKAPNTSGPLGSAARGAAEGAAPAVSGLAAGFWTTAALAPEIGPLALIPGFLVGMGAGTLAEKGQDWVLDKLGMRDNGGMFDKRQVESDRAQHPYMRAAGEMAPAAAGLKFSGSGMQRLLGAGVGGAAEAGLSWIHGEDPDPIKVAMGAGMGAAMPSANRLGAAVEASGERTGQAVSGYLRGNKPAAAVPAAPKPTDPTQQATPAENIGANVKPPEPEAGAVSDIEPLVDPAQEKDLSFAVAERDKHPVTDPLWRFWDEHVTQLQTKIADPADPVQASQGADAKLNPFTPADSKSAVQTVATGTAMEQGPAPQVAGAGNPVGAPMEARTASRPLEPTRNYEKLHEDLAGIAEDLARQPSVKVSEAPIHEDMALALGQGAKPKFKELPPDTPPRAEPSDLSLLGTHEGPEPHIPDVPRPPDQPIHPVEQTAQTFGRMEPLEASQLQRDAQARALANVRERNQGAQGGAETPLGPLPTERPAAPAAAQVARPEITPADKKLVLHTLDELKKNGMSRIAGEIEALKPHEAVVAAKRLSEAVKSEVDATKTAEGRPTVKGGVQARSNVDRARKEGALNAVEKAAEKYRGTLDLEKAPVALRDRVAWTKHIAEMFDHAKELFDGQDPTLPVKGLDGKMAGGYKPNEKNWHWQLVRAARDIAKAKADNKPATPAQLRDYAALEKLGPEGAKDAQQTKRIDTDIENKPQIEESSGDAMIAKERETEPNGRIDHEPYVPGKGQDDHPDTVRGHNRLRDWLNGLSEDTYKRLAETNDIDTDVRTTRDPDAVMQEYLNDLTKNSPKRPPLMDTGAETGPVVKKTPIRNRADLDRFAPTEEGKAAGAAKPVSAADFKRIAAEKAGKLTPEQLAAYKAKKAGKPVADTRPDRLAAEEQAQLGHEPSMASDDRPVIDGSEQGALRTFLDMMSDESGSAKTDQLLDWMKTKVTDAFAPAALDPIKEYAKNLGGAFNLLSNRLTQFRAQLKANAISANIDGKPLDNAQKSRMYRAMENGETGLLPGKEKKYYDDFVKPLKQDYERKYDTYRQRAIDEGLIKEEDLPERKNNGNGFQDWVPRLKKGQKWEGGGVGEENDPLGLRGQNLSNKADTLRDRDFFTLQNTNGDRMMYIPGDDKITVMRNGNATPIKTTGSFDPREIGSTTALRVKGKPDVWTVDHANIDEIMAGVGKGTDGKPLIEYHDDPVVAYTNALYGLNNALEKVNLYISVKNDPIFKAYNTMSHKQGKEMGWVQPDLPQFAKHYMPEQMAWAMDDYFKRGFYAEGKLGDAKQALDRASSTFAKMFYFFGPAVHVMNEMDKWSVGRGFNWVTPQGWKSLVVNGAKAIKSVHTQDAIQREMTNNGANPMLAHTVTRNIMEKVAKATALDIQKNHSKWDPFARAFNISTKDLMAAMYEKSTAAMWYGSDVLLTQRYLEEKQLRGLSPADAVKSAHDFIDSYRMPTTVGSKVLGEGGGRLAQKFLSDPTFSLFGPYHYGVFHSIAHVLGNLAGPSATLKDRGRAAGQLAVQLGMLYAVYPLLTAGYRAVTGQQNAEVEPRGMSRLLNTGKEIGKGEKGAEAMMRNFWTPSVIGSTVTAQSSNKDFRGKDILDPQPLDLPGIRDMSVQEIDFLARQLVSPYNTVSQAALKPDAGPGDVARKFTEGMFGIREPSDAEQRRRDTIEKVQMRNQRAREKRPAGGLEWINNQLK